MKNKPKRPRSPDPHSRLGNGIRHLFRLSGFALVLILLLTLLHLLIIGIPTPLTHKITNRFQEAGIPLLVDSITLSPHRGWVLHNVRVYSTAPDDLKPLLQTDRLYLQIWPRQWRSLSRNDWNINLESKSVAVSLGLPWEKGLDHTHPFRTISQLQFHLHTAPSQLTVDSAEIHWGGYILRASGTMGLSDKKKLSNPALYSIIQTRATQAAKLLSRLTFNAPPDITVRFDLPPETPEQAAVGVNLFADGFQRQGRFYNRIYGALHLRNGQTTLDALRIAQQDHTQLNISGLYNHSTGAAELSVDNTLRAADLIGLLPERAAGAIARLELQPLGAADFTAELGPCPPMQLLEQVHLQADHLSIARNDLTFDPARFALVRSGSRLSVTNLQATANGGPLTASAEIDLQTRSGRVTAQGRIPTGSLGTLLGGKAQEWINRINFTNRAPDISADVSWSGQKRSLRVNADLSGEEAVCAGIPLDMLEMSLSYSNRIFALTPIRATRGNRQFDGTVEVDFDRDLAFFDVNSNFDPVTVAQILAPDHPTVLTNFSFSGPVQAAGSGQVDYSGGTNHAFQGTLRAEEVSAAGLNAKALQSRVEGRGSALVFSNSSMTLFDGTVSGSAAFDLHVNNGTSPYSLNLDAARLDLSQIAHYVSTNDHRNTSGRLSAAISLSADANTEFWDSAQGQGEVKIENGQLHDIPVLGGFSRLVRTTIPGFSLFSITTLHAKFDLRDEALHTDKLELGGTIFSARASGSFSPEKGLNFMVQGEPLRQTRENKEWYQLHLWGADVLKQSTAPLFRLLKFQLTGPLNNPQWRLVNLPKEFTTLLQNPTSLLQNPDNTPEKSSPAK